MVVLAGMIHVPSAFADKVKLRSGDVLEGKIVERTDTHIILEHPDLGRLRISTDNVLSTSPEQEKEEEAAGVETEVEKTPSEKDEKKVTWKFGLVFGGSLSNDDEGEKASLNARVRVFRTRPGTEAELDLFYLYKIDNGEIDENSFYAALSQKWLSLEKPWVYLVKGRYDYDDFRSWQQRAQAHTAVGYRLVDREKVRLTPLVGLGFRKDIGSEEEPLLLEGVAGASFYWKPAPLQDLELATIYYPALNENDYRVVVEFDWKLRFHEKSQFSLNLHADYEYATDPDPGFPNDNYKVTWGLQWDF